MLFKRKEKDDSRRRLLTTNHLQWLYDDHNHSHKIQPSQPNVTLCPIGCMCITEYPKHIYEKPVFNDPIEQTRNMSFREYIPILELPRWLSGKRIHLPMQETQVPSLGQEDPLQEEMATDSSIFAWEIPWTEEPGGLQSMGHKESDTAEHAHTAHSYIKSKS